MAVERKNPPVYLLGGFVAGLVAAAAYASLDAEMLTAAGILVAVSGMTVFGLGWLAERSDVRLLDRETSYRAFFENAVEGVFRTTPDGRYISVNMALAKIYGYATPAALIDGLTDIASQLYVDANRRDEFKALMDANDQVTNFVSEIRRGDGSTIWISENARAVRDWNGRILCYEGLVEDVTAKIDAEQTIRVALREAEDANRAKTAFLSAMSHELRTPLNAIIGFSEIVKDELLGPSNMPAYRDYANDIHVSGVRLLAIINDILDASKLECGQVALACEPCDVRVLVQDAVAFAQTLTGDKREVAIEIDSTPPEIDVDANRFQQCLVKLLANAFKFTPQGGNIKISATADADGGMRIAVADTGIGMEPSLIAAALEPFHQLDGSLARRFGGTGLGLSITKALVELHGGTLAIESVVGNGTEVAIHLPPERVLAPAQTAVA